MENMDKTMTHGCLLPGAIPQGLIHANQVFHY